MLLPIRPSVRFIRSERVTGHRVCLLELWERRHGEFTTDRLFQVLSTTVVHAYASPQAGDDG